MTSPPDHTPVEPIRDAWSSGLDAELEFWREWFRTGGLQWPDEYRLRLDPRREFQPHLRWHTIFPKSGPIRVLDVGAGPLTLLGKWWPGRELEITAVDPLADRYDEFLRQFNVTPLVRTIKGDAERLLDLFAPATFDLAYAGNCLDHSYDPIAALRNMVAVVKPGCFVVTDHLINEGAAENYHGLHQWNFCVDRARFTIWRPGTRTDVQEALGDYALVEARQMPRSVLATVRRLTGPRER